MLRLIAFDVDGVLTDGRLVLGEKSEEYKIFHAHDGLGLVMLRKAGLHIAIISSRSSKIVAERMASLGINLVYQGRKEKRGAIIEIMQKLEVSKDETAYVGDDLIDIAAAGDGSDALIHGHHGHTFVGFDVGVGNDANDEVGVGV